ncbi:MAG: hypothetical protein GY863_18090, partial [bacterium]|nr:hypothetical protein [bacterium]
IIRIDPNTGEFEDFIDPAVLGMLVLGLNVDESRKTLWACAFGSAGPPFRSTVAKFNLHTGRLINSFECLDSLQSTINDLTLDSKGNAYYTNMANNSIYKIDISTDSVELVCKSKEIEFPNGITISPDDKYLYVASSTKGIRVIRLEDHMIIDDGDQKFKSTGIDGLKYYKGTLIGIQNYVEDTRDIKIARYFLDEQSVNITGMEIIDQDNPHFDTPTTFVIVEDHLYCIANSQVGNFSGGKVKDPSILQDIVILKYRLFNND